MNQNPRGRGHWSDSSHVLRDYLRTSSQPMNPSRPAPNPVDVQQEQAHVSATTGSPAYHVGGGFHVGAEGPNLHVGGKSTDEVSRLDAQVNLGGVSVAHRTPDHEYKVGVNAGWGGGARVHHGEQPGFGADIGPVSVDVRDSRFASTPKDAASTSGQ